MNAVFFDMDGTLIDSKADLAATVNHTRRDLGLAEVSQETVIGFVGRGADYLLDHAIPEHVGEKRVREIFQGHYAEHCVESVTLYPGVRETFAILMFLRASGGTPADLSATLVGTMPNEKNRELATNEWIKPAMGDGQEQTYDPLLGAAQAGEEPDHAIVTSLTGAHDMLVAMLGYLADERSKMSVKTEKMGGGAFVYPTRSGTAPNSHPDIGLNRIPRTFVSDDRSPYHTVKRGKRAGEEDDGGYEPVPYPWQ